MQGLKNKEQMFKKKYEKYAKILNRLMWLNACSSGISIATGISSVATFATFVELPVNISLGVASLTGAIASGIISTLTKKYQKKLKKVTSQVLPRLVPLINIQKLHFQAFCETVEPTSLKFCTIIGLISLHLEYTIAQVKYANFSYVHVQTFVLLNGEMATVSTGFRKLKFWLWLLRSVFYLNQTSF